MAIQLSVAARNDKLDAIETTIGVGPHLRIVTGAPPANCAAAATGLNVAILDLPTDWMAAAASGQKSKSGTWTDSSANATGTAAHFRIYETSNNTCHMQGTVGIAGSGADMIVDNVSFVAGQAFSVLTFTLSAGNA